MSQSNPFKPITVNRDDSGTRDVGRFLLSLYAFATMGCASFALAGIALLLPNGLQLIPGLNESIGFVVVLVITLMSGLMSALVCSRILRLEHAAKFTVFAMSNAVLAVALITVSAALEFTNKSFRIFPSDWDLLAPAHYAMCGFAILGGNFGLFGLMIEVRSKRYAAAVAVGTLTLACFIFLGLFFRFSGAR
jgi:hypothetical protein